MTLQIAVIIGHPLSGSLNHSLAESYMLRARELGASVEVIDLAVEDFPLSPRLSRDELRARSDRELADKGPVIESMVRRLQSADHFVFFYPSWWGTYPAVLKGFIDMVFLSGIAFVYGDRPTNWTRLFSGKTARIFTTMDTPRWYNRIKYRDASGNSFKHAVLWYTGVRTVGITRFDQVRFSRPETRSRWFAKVAKHARRDLESRR